MTSGATGDPPSVIGVVGAPRSGSTILGAALAKRTGGVHVGELHLLWDRLATNRLCGCGLEVRSCPFWTDVWNDVRHDAGLSRPEEACELWADAVRMRRAFVGRSTDHQAMRFASLMEQVYHSISARTGASVVIDSSKHPGYFVTLARADLPFTLVQLTRDPRALAFSWSRPKADPDQPGGQMKVRKPAVVAIEWMGLNGLGLLAGRKYGDFRRLRYESYVRDGLDDLDGALAAVPSRPQADREIDEFNHTVAGNPLRLASVSADLRIDDRWIGGQRRVDRLIVTAITSPMLRMFGYRFPVGS